MIILIVLLPALLLSEEVREINWQKCGQSKCYCSETDNQGNAQLLEYQYEIASPDKIKKCADAKVGIQHIFFNEKNALFQIQVKVEDTEQLGDSPTLEFYHGPKLLFGCKLENGEVKIVEKQENKEVIQRYKISLFESRSIMKKPTVLCAIQARKARQLEKSLTAQKTTVKLSWMSKEFQSDLAHKYFFKPTDDPKAIKCDPYSFQDLETSQAYIFHPLLNRDADVLTCDNYNSQAANTYTLRQIPYQKRTNPNEDHEAKQIKCVGKNDDFYFVPVTTDPNDDTKTLDSEEITDPESYNFYCAAPFDDLCEDPIVGCVATASNPCPQFTPRVAGTPGQDDRRPATLGCAGGKWLINKEYHELNTTCMKNTLGDSNTAIFFAQLKTGRFIPVPPDAVCFANYDCSLVSKLELPKNDTSSEDSVVDDSDGILKCNDMTRVLIVFDPATNEMMNSSSSYTCDPVDGKYKNGSTTVPVHSRLRCKDVNHAPTQEKVIADLEESQIIYLIVGFVALVIAALIVGFIGFYCFNKHRYKLRFKKISARTNLSKTELIADCKDDYGMILQATVSSSYLIMDGFKKLDRLLEQEIKHPEVWACVEPFLMRFHGMVFKNDLAVKHMFSRYMFLQAKKIIDKYGWRTKTKIRNDKREGLMRAVAINLLTYVWDDKQCSESIEFIVDGFRELGFNGISQYPHCGQLWAILCYVKPTFYQHKVDKRRTTFNQMEFIENLEKYLNAKLPMPQVIPAFGTVPEQAAFALGALPNFRHVMRNAPDYILKPDPVDRSAMQLQLRYFAGMLKSYCRTPIQAFLEAFNLVQKPKALKEGEKAEPTITEKMAKVAPEEEWRVLIMEAVEISSNYGRHIDVKRICEKLLPNGPNPDFVKLQLDQKNFEDAVTKSMEDIREWFAAHTDIAEFKKKPDYAKAGKTGFADPVTFVKSAAPTQTKSNAETKSKGAASGSKSSGGSDSKNSDNGSKPASPSDPKDAAAAAAAAPAASPAPAAATPAAPAAQ